MLIRSAALALGLAAAIAPAKADPVSDFYRGKNIQLIVGYGPGGGYDVYARLVARFFGKHVPGAPGVVVQNMPGAGSLRAANYIYVTAPRDGTVIGTFARNMPLLGVLKDNPNVQFDPRKFTWLGSPSSAENDAYLLFANKDAAVKTSADLLKKGGPPLVLGGTAEGATGNDVTILLKDALDLNLKMIAGYPDSGALFLAADRKEIDGRFVGLSAVASSKPDWLKPDSKMHVLLQFARKTRHKDFPDAPTAREIAPNDRARELVELAEIPYSLSRPFVAPPALPADRAAALQKAFLDTNADPEYVAEAQKIGVDVSPVGAHEAAEMIDKLAAAPPDLLDYIKKLQ
jgi:tripartite-type tricarboxylate transporter receptor subunit TctC